MSIYPFIRWHCYLATFPFPLELCTHIHILLQRRFKVYMPSQIFDCQMFVKFTIVNECLSTCLCFLFLVWHQIFITWNEIYGSYSTFECAWVYLRKLEINAYTLRVTHRFESFLCCIKPQTYGSAWCTFCWQFVYHF